MILDYSFEQGKNVDVTISITVVQNTAQQKNANVSYNMFTSSNGLTYIATTKNVKNQFRGRIQLNFCFD